MTRILSIWWPRLAIERWRKTAGKDFPPDAPPYAPVVLTVEGTHGLVISAVTRAAAASGARVGARLTDARALDPGLVAVPADPAGDAALVGRLAHWAARWSPLVEVDGGDGLRLDVTGVGHLFGGEAALAEDVRTRFAALGLTSRVAVAPTPGAAWALSHFCWTPHPNPLPQGERKLAAALAPLPVAALRLSPQVTRTLERLGLKTIGALARVPRRALARRFREADNPLDALDRALGRKPEPLIATPCEPPPRSLVRLEEPATHPQAASQALERLIPQLVRQLEQRHLGARRLALTGFRVDGSVAFASVATSIPSREPKHLGRLLADQAAALDPEFGFDAFALEADWTEALGAMQESLVEEPGGARDIARLIDRLSVKLGPERVRRPVQRESHLPERASGWARALFPSPSGEGRRGGERMKPLDAAEEAASRASSPLVRHPPPTPSLGVPTKVLLSWGPDREGRRPERLLDRPEAIAVIYATPEGVPRRFMWRRAVHDIARAEGPERIAPEWWRAPSKARLRDYYRVEDSAGRRFWIYREGVAGDRRGGAPAWYLHGLFG
ncbi:MAG TPA: DNA polymerase Y family protein [Sphingomicrobium sp.]|nr:DNA polymerase Y family protein [Sphingomicrobium sp.]